MYSRGFMLDGFKMAAGDQRHVTREHLFLYCERNGRTYVGAADTRATRHFQGRQYF